MLTNREKRYLIESVLESLNEGAPVEPTEEEIKNTLLSGRNKASKMVDKRLAKEARINAIKNTASNILNPLRDPVAITAGGAGIGALVGGIVGATTKKARIARLRNAIKKCGGNEECIAKLEATLNRLESGTNWSALIGAAIGGGLGSYGGSKYYDVKNYLVQRRRDRQASADELDEWNEANNRMRGLRDV